MVFLDSDEVGSPGYMAPELMMRPANEKTDAFALGVVLCLGPKKLRGFRDP